MNTPIERLRQRHVAAGFPDNQCCVVLSCGLTWPCDTIAALEALGAENVRLRAVVDEVKEWHEQECNCLCDCGECNKPSEPCPLGAAIAALAGDKEATS